MEMEPIIYLMAHLLVATPAIINLLEKRDLLGKMVIIMRVMFKTIKQMVRVFYIKMVFSTRAGLLIIFLKEMEFNSHKNIDFKENIIMGLK